ncbi:hypothetical protein QQS21_012026 [Conoideocrella luteorostrata]|uniref:NACHT domain-containing protein n=1 Tax=Conoideocrella luteorostrata TaxID=1105319 RepID=A0AAJ0CBZ7_9HYPO|nr:hypothetical protein QQS21_012026 [Conoideocrella luteorostrata]
MADRRRDSTFQKGDGGHQFNAVDEGIQNNNIGDGNQFPGAFFNGDVNFGPGPRSSEHSPQERCSQSLAFPEMESRSKDVDTATPETCEWLLRHPIYKSWEQSNQNLLWVKGKPGSGKSTLMRHVLNKMQADNSYGNAIILSFFFHGRGVELQRTPLGLFRSLLYQLLRWAPDTLLKLVGTFEERCKSMGIYGKTWEWHLNELKDNCWLSLPKVLESRPVWLYIDALDEISSHARHILEEFQSLRDTGIPNFITEKANGLFIWARLVVDQALELDRRGKEQAAIQQRIRSVPPELDQLYRQLIEKMDERQDSLRLIQWVCFAIRPLSLDELRWALLIDPAPTPHSLEKYRSKDNWISNINVMKEQIQALSRGLVEVITLSNTQAVQFIHQSVKDYFIDKGISTLAELQNHETLKAEVEGCAHYQLSRICVHYLAMEEIGQLTSDERGDKTQSPSNKRDDMASKFPFLHYAATSWVAHTKRSETRNTAQDDLLEYFNWPSEKLIQRWVQLYHVLGQYSNDCPLEGTSMIHLVSQYQLLEPLRVILRTMNQNKIDINVKDSSGRTPLSWAAGNGQIAAVRLLLEVKGSGRVRTPLPGAAGDLQSAFTELGIARRPPATGKAHVDIKDNTGVQAPPRKISVKPLAIIKGLFVKYKVDINTKDNNNRTPLSWAAANGHETIVNALLAIGKADINVKDKYSQTPLLWAAKKGHETVVKALLATGEVDVDAKDDFSQTPLIWAAKEGHDTIVKALLATGKVDINAKDTWYGQTSLSWAAEGRHETVVKALLATGKVDINAKNDSSQTPLLLAAKEGHETVVKALLATGKVGINAKNDSSQTPLLLAAMKGHETIAKALLATGKVDINAKDDSSQTPLFWAAKKGHETIVKALLATGKVDVNAKNDSSQTPLFWAAKKGHETIVKALLATGKVDINAKDDSSQTPLSWAAMKGHETIVKALLATGKVDINIKDEFSRTSLWWAARWGHETIVKALLATGKVDVNAKDTYS